MLQRPVEPAPIIVDIPSGYGHQCFGPYVPRLKPSVHRSQKSLQCKLSHTVPEICTYFD